MRQVVVRVAKFCRTPEGWKLIKYTTVSAISALTSIVVLTLVYGVLRLWAEVPSVLFSNVVAGVPSYLLNRQWVWGKSGRSHLWREVIPFWVVTLTGIGFALFTASLAQHFAETHHLHHLARTVLVVGTNVGAFALVWLLKFMILNRLFRELADKELGEAEPPVAVDPASPAPGGTPPTLASEMRAD